MKSPLSPALMLQPCRWCLLARSKKKKRAISEMKGCGLSVKWEEPAEQQKTLRSVIPLQGQDKNHRPYQILYYFYCCWLFKKVPKNIFPLLIKMRETYVAKWHPPYVSYKSSALSSQFHRITGNSLCELEISSSLLISTLSLTSPWTFHNSIWDNIKLKERGRLFFFFFFYVKHKVTANDFNTSIIFCLF